VPKIIQITATSTRVYALLEDGSLHYNEEGIWRVAPIPLAWMQSTSLTTSPALPGKIRPKWDSQNTRDWMFKETCSCGTYIFEGDTSTWYSHYQQGHLDMQIAPTRE